MKTEIIFGPFFLAEIRISMGSHHGICDVLEAENTVAYRGLGIGHYNMG